MTTIIEAKNLSKYYHNTVALDDVSFTIEKGKIYGLLGRNGAGKTTLLNILCNYISPTKGTYKLFNQPFSPSMLNDIGIMIESPAFYDLLTGKENLDLIKRGRNLNEKAIDDVFKLLDLSQNQHRLYKHYSLGMKQKLYLAQAIMHKPKLLILDEPINGLDPISISELRKLFIRLCKEHQTTILISSHLLKELELIADDVLILEKGRLINASPMQQLIHLTKKTYYFDVDDINKAKDITRKMKQDISVTVEQNLLSVTLSTKSDLSPLLHELLLQGITINDIRGIEEDLETVFTTLLEGKRS